MSKYNEIRQALLAVEQGKFQLVCIDYLKHNVGGIIDSPGTMLGKEKTRKGQPDIYIAQKDGNYVLAECTTRDGETDRNEFYKKLESDLLSCLDFEKLKVPKEKISSIYLCCNSSIEPVEKEMLAIHTKPFGIHLEVVSVFELTAHLSSSGKSAAKDLLGIEFLTGQILTKEQFLIQYQRKNISTPLNNPLVGREQAIEQLADLLEKEHMIILSGDPGVGKSKLAIEAVSRFEKDNPEYKSYYVMSKSGEITEDLATFIKLGSNYILMVDDANRQLDNLTRILDRVIETTSKIKIVMTVREYAKKDLIKQLGELQVCKLELRKLSDETIRQIVSGDPFLLQSWKIIDRIVKVSDGNPRLAIMAADTMKNSPEIALLSDVSRIYDNYFKSILFDNPLFEDRLTRQVMGIVSFFYTVDITVESEWEIIRGFGIDVTEFSARAQELEESEIIDLYNGNIVKISEQVMATYFFYDSFFRNPVLDFQHLLSVHFDTYLYRFKDSLLGAIDAFGTENIIGLIRSSLLEFWDGKKTDWSFAVMFLRFFSRILPEPTFIWLEQHVGTLPDQPIAPVQKTGTFLQIDGHEGEVVLGIIETFFEQTGQDFQTAVHLALEYVAKQRGIAEKLIEKLATAIFISKHEIAHGLPKLEFVYQQLLERSINEPFYKTIFFPLMDKAILRPSGREELYEHKNGIYTLSPIFAQLRLKFLEKVAGEFATNKVLGFKLLLDYAIEKRDLRSLEIDNDFPLIFKMITEELDNSEIANCYLADRYVVLAQKKTAAFPTEVGFLKKYFHTPTFLLYQLLSMRQIDRTDNLSWDDFHLLKSQMIEQGIKIQTIAEFISLHKQIEEIAGFDKARGDISDGMAILFRKILTDDQSLGLECLDYYLSKGNVADLSGSSIYAPIFNKEIRKDARTLYNIISAHQFPYCHDWLIRFFYFLPQQLFDRLTFKDLFDCLAKHPGVLDIYPSHFEKFEQVRPGTIEKVLKLLVAKSKKSKNFLYKLSHAFFAESLPLLKHNLRLCELAYYQQEHMQGSYDHDGKELLLLTAQNNGVFGRYIDNELKTRERLNLSSHRLLGRIWDFDFAGQIVYDTVLRISKLKSYEKSDHCACAFLYGTDQRNHEAAYKVFSKLVSDHPTDIELLNTVLDTLRNTVRPFYLGIIQQIIEQNHQPDFFDQLELHNNHFDYSTAETWPDHKAKELTEIKDSIVAMPNGYKYFAIKNYLDKQIEKQKLWAAGERKDKFRGFW